MTTGQVYQSLQKAANSRTPPIEPTLKQEKQLQKSVQKRKANSLLICTVNFTFDFGTNHDVKVGLISESSWFTRKNTGLSHTYLAVSIPKSFSLCLKSQKRSPPLRIFSLGEECSRK